MIDETEQISRSYRSLDDASTPSSSPGPPRDRSEIEDQLEPTFVESDSGSGSEPDLPRSDVYDHIATHSSQQRATHSRQRSAASEPSIENPLYQTNPLAIQQPLEPSFVDFAFSPSSQSVQPRYFTDRTASWTGTYVPPFSLGQAISKNVSPLPEPSLPVSNAERARLICSFLQETGTWCETTDSEMHFTVRSIHSMMESAAFAAAAMSLASRQLDYIESRHRPATLELYQYTIQLLLRQDPAKADAAVLATCTLLCVYEMMASGVHEWRRHLKVCWQSLKSSTLLRGFRRTR